MSASISALLESLPTWLLFIALGFALYVLSRGAGLLVDEAVRLAARLAVPPVVIGATVVSLGTTTPEAAVSVFAALQGRPDLALGNAVGSIICDAGLILGIGAVLRPLPIDRRVVDRQGWMQLAAAFLLVALCLPWSSLPQVFIHGGRLPQAAGFVLVGLLALYLYDAARFGRRINRDMAAELPTESSSGSIPLWIISARLLLGVGLLIAGSHFTILTVEVTAVRVGIPREIVAVSIVALGTSMPELATVITSVYKGRGDLAIGNVIGADILNVLFVAGLSAAVSTGGLQASPVFFTRFFPVMLILLLVFRLGVRPGNVTLGRSFGLTLLSIYGAFTLWNFLSPAGG